MTIVQPVGLDMHAPESTCVILIGDNFPAINWSLDFPIPTVNGGHLEDHSVI